MPFFKILPRPGIVRDPTQYSSEGSWYDSDKIRFRGLFPETIGGWIKQTAGSFLGTARMVHDWTTAVGKAYLGVGTTVKLYVNANDGTDYYDITPIRRSVTLGSDPIATVDTSGVVTITDTNHGAVAGDYVTISGAATTRGIAAGTLNAEHRINTVPSSSTYTILVGTAATSTGSGGGASVVAQYQANTGLDTFVPSLGWGYGGWGSTPWGGPTTISASGQLRHWSMDNFGDDLIACIRGGDVCYWDESAGTSTRSLLLSEMTRKTLTLGADPITTVNTSATITVTDNLGHDLGPGDEVLLSGAVDTGGITAAQINTTHTVVATPTETTFTVTTTGTATSSVTGGGSSVVATYYAGTYYGPVKALRVMVSDQESHVILIGANQIGSTVLDPMMVRWSDSENATVWRPTNENLAGGRRLSSGSMILGAIKTRQEIVIWTDVNLVSMRYVGSPFVYTFDEIAQNTSLIAPRAFEVAGGVVYFMDRGGFYSYSGALENLPCPVEDYVFNDLDTTQAYKIFAGGNRDFNEISWFYPSLSGGTGEIDKYVTYNYVDKTWYYGSMVRGTWSQASSRNNPIASTIRKLTLADGAVATTNTSGNVVVTSAGHGLVTGDVVILSGVASVGGIAANVLNAQHTLTAYSTDTFTFTVVDVATSTATGGGTDGVVRCPNYLYKHEYGHTADGSAITSYIESSDIDIEEGDNVWFISRLIPDIKFLDESGGTDTVTLTLRGHDLPGNTQTSVATASVGATTAMAHVRARARQVSLKASADANGYGWRLGAVRMDARPDGRR